MNHQEEELQRNIEDGLNPIGNDVDIRAYREVFERLGSKPSITLPDNFADSIITRVVENKKRDASRDFLWLGAGIFFLVVMLVVAAVLSDFTVDLGFIRNMSPYAGLFIFGVAFILFLNRIEKRLLADKANTSNIL